MAQRLPATTGDVAVTTLGITGLVVAAVFRIAGVGFRPRPDWADLALNIGLVVVIPPSIFWWWRGVKSWRQSR